LSAASGFVVRAPRAASGPLETGATVCVAQRDAAAARATPGTALDAGDAIATGTASSAAISFYDGGRLSLDPDGVVLLGNEAASQTYLVRGSARATLSPAPNAPRPPLRIATPAATIDVGGSAELVVAVLSPQRTWVAVLAGSAAVVTGAADGDPATDLRAHEDVLEPGRAALVDGDEVRIDTGPARAADVPAALAQLAAPATSRRGGRLDRVLAADGARLDEIFARAELGATLAADLAMRHARAAREDRSRAASLQREIAVHASRQHRVRALVLARWERLLARALTTKCGAEARVDVDAAIASRRERVLRALGRAGAIR